MDRILEKKTALFETVSFSFVGFCLGHECPDEVGKQPTNPDPGWMESEVIAGFRVWQILFLIGAGICTLVIVACCFKRCRIPRTRQEIEANHKRYQITLLFRSYLDRVPCEEIDLMWALDVVKEAAEKRRSKRKKKKVQFPDDVTNKSGEDGSLEQTEEEESEDVDRPKKPQTLAEKIKGIFIRRPPIEFSDDESNQFSNSLENCSL
nr:transmembrane inner ear expressed protein [Parasteatoda tepidariorum]